MVFKELYRLDMMRYGGHPDKYIKKFHYFFRKCQLCNIRVLNYGYRWIFQKIKEKRGLEISYRTKIGKGLYLGHAYNITINASVVIGEYCNIHKGVTLGQENRGSRKGTPVIGNKVWIGVNATVVGNVKIGDDVLIAPNSFVNCDVPIHSIVFGNPCVIKHKDDATKGYINCFDET